MFLYEWKKKNSKPYQLNICNFILLLNTYTYKKKFENKMECNELYIIYIYI